jgi:hypothetical protein
MKTVLVAIVLLLSTFGSAAFAARGSLEGWEQLRFGMTTAQVIQAAGPRAQYEDTFLSGPVVVWPVRIGDQPAQIAAFVPDGKLNSIKVFLPDVHHETKQQCHERLDAIVTSLSKQYGAPDEEDDSGAAGSDISAWHAIFRFQNGAWLDADADLHDRDFTCTADLLYEAPK